MTLNLMNYRITVGQILSNPNARALAYQEFPVLHNPRIRRMVWNMPLSRVIQLAHRWVPENRLRFLLHRLREI